MTVYVKSLKDWAVLVARMGLPKHKLKKQSGYWVVTILA